MCWIEFNVLSGDGSFESHEGIQLVSGHKSGFFKVTRIISRLPAARLIFRKNDLTTQMFQNFERTFGNVWEELVDITWNKKEDAHLGLKKYMLPMRKIQSLR